MSKIKLECPNCGARNYNGGREYTRKNFEEIKFEGAETVINDKITKEVHTLYCCPECGATFKNI